MRTVDRQEMESQRLFLEEQITKLPLSAALTRASIESALEELRNSIQNAVIDEREPARTVLTFDGRPVIGSYGIVADFGSAAVKAFTEAVATVAASLSAPLAGMGPIPQRDQYQMLITSTAFGSFGFELEEHREGRLPLNEVSLVASAIERTQEVLQGTLGTDDQLAESASETNPRALEKIRSFLTVVAEGEATCALQYRDTTVKFSTVEQIRTAVARLANDNLRETERQIRGSFSGVLPDGRTFEFIVAADQAVIRGKISSQIAHPQEINDHLGEVTEISVLETRVNNGRATIVLRRLPWSLVE